MAKRSKTDYIHPVKDFRYYAGIKHCMVLKTPDIGRALLQTNKTVYASWGLNLNVEEVREQHQKFGYHYIQRQWPNDDKFEVILPDVEKEFPLIDVHKQTIQL